MGSGEVGWLDLSVIEERTLEVLRAEHATFAIPIPIEEIIEVKYRIDIVPVPGLQNFDCVGYIDSGLSSIYVDEYIYGHWPTRYRFTLAHEFSHLILHEAYYGSFQFGTVQEWKIAVAGVPPEVHMRLEYQANMFAGYILVPTQQLLEQASLAVGTVEQNGLDARRSDVQGYMEGHLAKVFDVSDSVISRRMQTGHLWDKVT